MEKNIAGQGERSPSNAADLALQALNGARALADNRCGLATPSFTGSLGTQIPQVDSTNTAQFVYSFDASWLADIDRWKTCYQNKFGVAVDPIIIPPAAITPGSRAVMITNVQDLPCSNWQCDRSLQGVPDYVQHCCGVEKPCATPTPSPN